MSSIVARSHDSPDGAPGGAGDFEEFVRARWAALYRTAYLMLGDPHLAEDLVQTTMAKTYAAWPRVSTREAAPAYARQVLVNTASSWFRKKGWRNERPSAELPEASYAPDPSTRPAVIDALRLLPPRQRAVVVLRYFEDLSVEQTAHLLDITPGTVKSQTFQALATLRTLLGDAIVPHDLRSIR